MSRAYLAILPISILAFGTFAWAGNPPANEPTLFCPAQQLRVARCERQSDDEKNLSGEYTPAFIVRQMLVCQDKDKKFSLQVRYMDRDSHALKDTAPIPAASERLKDSSVHYTTQTGLNLLLSASRQEAVLQQCIPVAPENLNSEAYYACLERLAICR